MVGLVSKVCGNLAKVGPMCINFIGNTNNRVEKKNILFYILKENNQV